MVQRALLESTVAAAPVKVEHGLALVANVPGVVVSMLAVEDVKDVNHVDGVDEGVVVRPVTVERLAYGQPAHARRRDELLVVSHPLARPSLLY